MPTGYTFQIINPPDTPNIGRYKINYNFSLLTLGSITGISASIFTNPNPTTQRVGGIPAGSTFVTDYYLQDMMDFLLYPAVTPNFTAFEIDSLATELEVGQAIAGSTTFTWTIANATDLQANSIAIEDTTNSVVLISGLANDGTETISLSSLTKTAPAPNVWTISASDTDGVTFSTTFTVNWLYSSFYGSSANATLNAAQIVALSGGGLQSDINGSYALGGSNYGYVCVPDSFSSPTGFRDSSSNLPLTMAGPSDGYNDFDGTYYHDTVSVTRNGVNIDYRVYRTKSATTSSSLSVATTGATVATLQTVIDAGNIAYGDAAVLGSFSANTIFLSGTDLTSLLTGGTSTYVQDGINTYTGGTASAPTVNVSDDPVFSSVSATTLSASTIFSSGTDLNTILSNLASTSTFVQEGANTYTGGTAYAPTVNVSDDPVFSSVSATSISAITFYSAGTDISELIRDAVTTDLENVTAVGNTASRDIILQGSAVKVLFNSTIPSLSGISNSIGIDYNYGSGLNYISENPINTFSDFFPFDALYFHHSFQQDIYYSYVDPVIISFMSSSTENMSVIYFSSRSLDNTTSRGVNIFASGSSEAPYQVAMVNLPNRHGTLALVDEISGFTRVQEGVNIYTGGTASAPTVNVSDDPVFSSISATTLSASTIFSAGTDLNTILSNLASTSTFVQNGVNTYTAGTISAPTINVVDSPSFTSVSASSISATTIFFSGDDLSSLISDVVVNSGSSVNDNIVLFDGVTGRRIKDSGISLSEIIQEDPGSGIGMIESGVGAFPIVLKNVRAGNGVEAIANTGSVFLQQKFSGPDQMGVGDSLGDFTEVTLSASSAPNVVVRADGTGKIDSSFLPAVPPDYTYVQPGTNITTGGTITRPTVNVSSTPSFTSVSATSISATTFVQGGSLLSALFAPISVVPTYVQPGTNITTGGTITRPTINVSLTPSFTSVSATTFVQGGSLLSALFAPISVVPTYVQPGTNITTGGTITRPTINVSSTPSFTSISATTIYSGGTDLSTLLTGSSRSLTVRTTTATTVSFSLTDANAFIISSASTAVVAAVPSDSSVAFPIGTQIMFEQGSTGQLRFSASTGTVLNSYGSAYNVIGQYATAVLTKKDTNTWNLDGNLTTLSL